MTQDTKKQFEKELIQYGLKNNYIEKEKDGTLKFVGSKNKYSVESRLEQITKVEQILNDLERKVEEMEQQDYITYDLGKDLENISFMLDMLREENKNGTS